MCVFVCACVCARNERTAKAQISLRIRRLLRRSFKLGEPLMAYFFRHGFSSQESNYNEPCVQ